eukprot:m.1638783 g.1638783  ORF g.1638783 m.1638783 type:complete len:124 (-) comp30715_c0_seq1:79-450(-)
MGNPNSGSGNFRQETISHFLHASRSMQGKIMSRIPADHHGTIVHTHQGSSYLIHSTPGSGVVATPASHMSKAWSVGVKETANGATIQQAMKAAGGRTPNSAVNYASSGTCIFSSARVEKAITE